MENSLFPDFENEWEKEWKDLPEYSVEDKKPDFKLIISFESFEDAKAFSELINQKITPRTKSLWFPKKEKDVLKNLRYKKK